MVTQLASDVALKLFSSGAFFRAECRKEKAIKSTHGQMEKQSSLSLSGTGVKQKAKIRDRSTPFLMPYLGTKLEASMMVIRVYGTFNFCIRNRANRDCSRLHSAEQWWRNVLCKGKPWTVAGQRNLRRKRTCSTQSWINKDMLIASPFTHKPCQNNAVQMLQLSPTGACGACSIQVAFQSRQPQT